MFFLRLVFQGFLFLLLSSVREFRDLHRSELVLRAFHVAKVIKVGAFMVEVRGWETKSCVIDHQAIAARGCIFRAYRANWYFCVHVVQLRYREIDGRRGVVGLAICGTQSRLLIASRKAKF